MQNEEEQSSIVESSFMCPSFSTYSSNNVNDVAYQLTLENDTFISQNDTHQNDFEFVAFPKTTTDETFHHHHHRHSTSNVFPIFNRELFSDEDDDRASSDTEAIRIPLKNLLIGDEKRGSEPLPPLSASSSEDDLKVIPAKSYCLWTPKSPQASPSKFNLCKKSNSTGSSSSSSSSSSKKWKFLSLLRRSKSDGKQSLVALTPSSPSESPLLALKKGVKEVNSKKKSDENKDSRVAGKMIPATVKKIPATVKKIPASAVHEALYGRKREIRRTSYLPYKQHLVGFGVNSNFNSMARAFPLHF